MANSKRKRGRKDESLKPGEYYRDKQDIYVYTYRTIEGKRKCIYAKDLKKLREREGEIIRDKVDGIDSYLTGNATINFVFDRYISTRDDLRISTLSNYKFYYDKHIRDGFGKRKIGSVVHSEVVAFYMILFKERDLSVYTVETINSLLSATFNTALRDNIIRFNPVNGAFAESRRRSKKKAGVRRALSKEQQDILVEHLNDPENEYWRPILIILLGTGLRVSELVGLRWDDVDIDRESVDVNHAISSYNDYKGRRSSRARKLDDPKSHNGFREVPMLPEVRDAFIEVRDRPANEISRMMQFEGMTNFCFCSTVGTLLDPKSLNNVLHRITDEHNYREVLRAKAEDREPVFLPNITCHVLRHTFCTRLCEAETNLKTIQTIMGHGDIQTTLNIYADVMESTKKESLKKLSDFFDGKESDDANSTNYESK